MMKYKKLIGDNLTAFQLPFNKLVCCICCLLKRQHFSFQVLPGTCEICVNFYKQIVSLVAAVHARIPRTTQLGMQFIRPTFLQSFSS